MEAFVDPGSRHTLLRWIGVIACGVVISAIPAPSGITHQSWLLLAVFAGTIAGSILRPAPAGQMVLLGVVALALFRVMPVDQALKGYSDPIVWLVLAAFSISCGMLKTGLGRRIAFLFIRAVGRSSMGLAYALAATDMVLASVIPSNGARAGGIIFPIAKSISEAYDSNPGPSARRLGAFLMALLYQCDVIICAMFLTGQASNALIAKFAMQTAKVDLSYKLWFIGGLLPGAVSLAVVPMIYYRLFPPEIKQTPDAAEFAGLELQLMGPMSGKEKMMLFIFILVGILWMTTDWHHIPYSVVALVAIAALLICKVISWEDVLKNRDAWDVFLWYGGFVRMAEALGETGITKRFADVVAGYTTGLPWIYALAVLLLVYFYVHYGFASITAHATAMYIPFLVIVLAAGAPPYLAALSLAYVSNLSACLTQYGTTPGPIYFGSNYVSQKDWWRLGFVASIATILIWTLLGPLWWKVLGFW